MSNLAVVNKSYSQVDYFCDPEMIKVIKNNCAKGATDAEFAVFREYVRTTKLNPIKKEVWCIKKFNKQTREYYGDIQIMTGINGYYRIANDHPMFDGLKRELIFDKNNNIQCVKSYVYRKDKSIPCEGIAYLSEYRKTGDSWDQRPVQMLIKVADSIALRNAFIQELGGTYTAEEMPLEYELKNVVDINKQKNIESHENLTALYSEKKSEKAIKAHSQEDRDSLSIMIEQNKAWAYKAPDEGDGKYIFESSLKIKSHLTDNNVLFKSDKQKKCVWVADEIEELKEFCCFNPVVYADEQRQVMEEDVPF